MYSAVQHDDFKYLFVVSGAVCSFTTPAAVVVDLESIAQEACLHKHDRFKASIKIKYQLLIPILFTFRITASTTAMLEDIQSPGLLSARAQGSGMVSSSSFNPVTQCLS